MDSYYDGIIDRFEKEYQVTVDLQTIPADQYIDLLQSKLTSGTLTDISDSVKSICNCECFGDPSVLYEFQWCKLG